MLFIYSPVGRLVLNSLFGSLNGTKYFQCEHWYSLLVQVKSTVLSPYFHNQHLYLHWLYTWHWLVNAYYFKFYLQLFITQNIPAKKKMSSTPIGASTTYQHYGWGTRQNQGTFDQWPISFLPGTYTKNIFPQQIVTGLWIIAGRHDSLSPPRLTISPRTSKIIQPWPNDFTLALVERSPCSWIIKFYIKPLFSGF